MLDSRELYQNLANDILKIADVEDDKNARISYLEGEIQSEKNKFTNFLTDLSSVINKYKEGF